MKFTSSAFIFAAISASIIQGAFSTSIPIANRPLAVPAVEERAVDTTSTTIDRDITSTSQAEAGNTGATLTVEPSRSGNLTAFYEWLIKRNPGRVDIDGLRYRRCPRLSCPAVGSYRIGTPIDVVCFRENETTVVEGSPLPTLSLSLTVTLSLSLTITPTKLRNHLHQSTRMPHHHAFLSYSSFRLSHHLVPLLTRFHHLLRIRINPPRLLFLQPTHPRPLPRPPNNLPPHRPPNPTTHT
ncbi:hypothetical protein CVT24_007822 [Panaeolus cyanescens]|uniref:Uncharacterized protein n=1 Tax=Panaeolus cyanescens TaxID=181874 RepID=A0A409WWH9_9AGAR|nr:hypothetical protein CVT24_007822 [Panaeolus cyanescens]